VAAAASYFASDGSRFTTGAELRIDGGVTLVKGRGALDLGTDSPARRVVSPNVSSSRVTQALVKSEGAYDDHLDSQCGDCAWKSSRRH
jgi:hypothetical protein